MNSISHIVLLLITASLIAIAVFNDVKSSLIPNYLTFTAMAVAVIYHGYMSGGVGMLFTLMGLLAGCAIFLLFYILGGMGAGDVKLMMAVGSLLGPRDVLFVALYTGVAGGVYAIISLARSGFIRNWLGGKLQKSDPGQPMDQNPALSLRYSIAVAAGTLVVLIERVLFNKSGACVTILG